MPVQTVEGWSEFSADIPTDALAVFKKSLAGLAGVSYHPVAYASQVVTGINYLFFCNSKKTYYMFKTLLCKLLIII